MKTDALGHAEGFVTIPAGIPSGTKLVTFWGNQGSYGETTYTGRGLITTEERQKVVLVRRASVDPLAQTFTLTEGRFIGGVEVWFTAKGTGRVKVQIRETNLGMPTSNVLSEGEITADAIKLNGATRLTFPPVWCAAETEYTFVLLTDDGEHAVAIAELGQYDAEQASWITAQPYQTGVLLSSSNAKTWTTHQERDLAFHLLACEFTETNRSIVLETEVEAENVSDLMILGNADRPTTQTDLDFSFTDASGEEYRLTEDHPLPLRQKISGKGVLRAHLKGTNWASPILYPGIQAVLGTVSEEADYVTRTLSVTEASKVTVTFEATTPGTSSVKVYLKHGEDWDWVELVQGTPVDATWDERTHIFNNFAGSQVQIKLVLSGTALYRPKVRSLRVIVT